MNLIVYDTETTGFARKLGTPERLQPEISDFFGVKLKWTGSELIKIDEFGFKCRTKRPIPEKIETLRGIKDSDYNGLPAFGHFHAPLRDFFDNTTMWVAHNLRFDSTMMVLELARLGKHKEFPWPPIGVCTQNLSRSLFAQSKHTLRDLHYRLCDQTKIQEHHADTDVDMLLDIIPELVAEGDFPWGGNYRVFG